MAVGILAIFFWVTLRQPVLAFVAVVPIIFVLVWVLGTMALVGIPYTLITSIITALSIGIGVDYTIHIIHRYREEFSHLRNPEQAAVRTLATTGSALLGSALTTALGLGAQDITGVGETDEDDISRVGNLIVGDRPADTGCDKLGGGRFFGTVAQFGVPGSARQRPELAVVMFKDLPINQAVQSQVNDRLRVGA